MVRVWPAAAVFGALVARCGALYDPVNHIESCRVYGNIDKYAYYFLDMLIGTPPQRVSVIVDTGSHIAAFPCASCKHCGNHIDPAFDFAKSTSAAWVGCDSCKGSCKSGHCSYSQSYTEGSSLSGWWFTDMVRIGDAQQRNPPVQAKLGCHQNENNLFYTQKANGILGIAPSSGAPTVLEELYRDREHVEKRVFALCLAEWGGRFVVGGWNASYHQGEIGWTPLTSKGTYAVQLSSMSVGGTPLGSGINFKHTIIDSGTTHVYMGSKPYRTLRAAIERYCDAHNGCGATRKGTCFTVKKDLKAFPDITVFFGTLSTVWQAKGYLNHKATSKNWCYSFMDDGNNANTVLGAAWMMHHEIIFDLRRDKVGIVQADCPDYKERPKHKTDLGVAELAPPAAATKMATSPPALPAPDLRSPEPSADGSTSALAPTVAPPAAWAAASSAQAQGGQRPPPRPRVRSKHAPVGAAFAALLIGVCCALLAWRTCWRHAIGEIEVGEDEQPSPRTLGRRVGVADADEEEERERLQPDREEEARGGSDEEDFVHVRDVEGGGAYPADLGQGSRVDSAVF